MKIPGILPIVKATKISRSKLISAITTFLGSFSANGENLTNLLDSNRREADRRKQVSHFFFLTEFLTAKAPWTPTEAPCPFFALRFSKTKPRC